MKQQSKARQMMKELILKYAELGDMVTFHMKGHRYVTGGEVVGIFEEKLLVKREFVEGQKRKYSKKQHTVEPQDVWMFAPKPTPRFANPEYREGLIDACIAQMDQQSLEMENDLGKG